MFASFLSYTTYTNSAVPRHPSDAGTTVNVYGPLPVTV